MGKGTIHLDLAAEVSDLDPSAGITIAGFTIPGLSTRQSETTVRLADGQSFAIAGLLSERVRSQIDKVPWLGSIPVLGALFRSANYKREETELLVIVTARLARPMAPHEVPSLPTDNQNNAVNNAEFFLMGWDAKHRSKSRNEEMIAEEKHRGPSGSVGFAR
jgi:pilus assembly protein CpaC